MFGYRECTFNISKINIHNSCEYSVIGEQKNITFEIVQTVSIVHAFKKIKRFFHVWRDWSYPYCDYEVLHFIFLNHASPVGIKYEKEILHQVRWFKAAKRCRDLYELEIDKL